MANYIYNDQFDLFVQNISVDDINATNQINEKSLLEISIIENKPRFFDFILKKVLRLKNCDLSQVNGEILSILDKRSIFLRNEYNAGYNRLHIAIIDGEPGVVHYILRQNLVDPNEAGVPIGTPLHLAILLAQIDCIEALIQYNVNVDILNKHHQTALQMSIEYGIHEVVKNIFRLSKNIDGFKHMGLSFLQFFIIKNLKELVIIILEVGADVHMTFITSDDESMEKEVNKHCSIRPFLPLSYIESSLTLCLKLHGCIYPELLIYLRDENINSTDGHGNTLLHLSASMQMLDLCQALISRGCDINFYNNIGNNALQEMFKNINSCKNSTKRQVNVGTLLINSGIIVDFDNWIYNDIVEDILSINSEKFFMLVIEKIILKITDIHLNSVVKRRWFNAATFILNATEHSLRLTMINYFIVQMYWLHASKKEALWILNNCSQSLLNKVMPIILDNTAEKDDLTFFKTLSEIGTLKPEWIKNGETLLTNLIKTKRLEYVKILLDSVNRGAYINVKNKSGESPLYLSIISRNIYLIDIFVFEHEEFNYLDSKGDTIFGNLFKFFNKPTDSEFLEKISKVMISCGASPFVKDSNGVMSIDYCSDEAVKSRLNAFAKSKIDKLNLLKPDVECKICLTRPVEFSLDCGHVFCSDCCEKFQKCPSCRKKFNTLRPIFF